MEKDKELVKKLGEKIGYGNMMHLASELWEESMIKKGYPTSGVFVPALKRDVREQKPKLKSGKLSTQRVNHWVYFYDNWSAIMLGFVIAISFSILLKMIETVIVKITLIIHGG
jgi:uncharacterized membrane protein YagU involved in acid resistance